MTARAAMIPHACTVCGTDIIPNPGEAANRYNRRRTCALHRGKWLGFREPAVETREKEPWKQEIRFSDSIEAARPEQPMSGMAQLNHGAWGSPLDWATIGIYPR